jgi:hypothetical protein
MPHRCSRGITQGQWGPTEMCVRIAQGRATLSLHQLWDELLTSSNHTGRKKNIAIDLISRFPRVPRRESKKKSSPGDSLPD